LRYCLNIGGSGSGGGGGGTGGGQLTPSAMQTIAANGTITIGTEPRQLLRVKSTGGPVDLNIFPFGAVSLTTPTEFVLFTDTDVDTVAFVSNDNNGGCIGNFERIELTKSLPIKATFDPLINRFFLSRY